MTQASPGHAAGVANDGYWGIPVRPNTRYRASLLREGGAGIHRAAHRCRSRAKTARTIYATGTVAGLTPAWKQYEVTLTTGNVDADREGALRR